LRRKAHPARPMTGSPFNTVHVIGAGLAGSEAAWQVANSSVPVVLHEMRPDRMTEAHRTDSFAELVCSNSFRSDDAANNAVGLLHAEMRRLGSLIMRAADANQVPAGGALAVDRDGFSSAVTKALHDHPGIEIQRREIAGLPVGGMAGGGRETLRHGPMKPVGLTNGHDPSAKPYAIVQLRQGNKLGSLYNLVGFQTKVKYGP